MNKYEFLAQLRNALSSVPQEEREAAMSYYEEFFSDAGEENEQAVISSFGSPEELARSIIDENRKGATRSADEPTPSGKSGSYSNPFTPPPTRAQQKTGWTGGQIALIIVLLVLSSPVWIGLLSALLGILISLFAVFICIIVAFGVSAILALVTGIAAFFTGTPAGGLFAIGVSLFFAGLFPLVIYPLCKLMIRLTKACFCGIASLVRKLTGRKGVA
ncbi:MAG: DUF1700 domain-containing protein [Oscillospiraceae bacterium]|nr:DUF1700 domain-containing protein [Oscillospiraceae bacterium]